MARKRGGVKRKAGQARSAKTRTAAAPVRSATRRLDLRSLRPWIGLAALALLLGFTVLAARMGAQDRPVEPHQARLSADDKPSVQGASNPFPPPQAPPVPREAAAVAPQIPQSHPAVPAADPVPTPPPVAVPSAVPSPQAQPVPPPPQKPVPKPHPSVAALPPVPPPPDGLPAWRRNAAQAPAPDGRPRIVVVIDDMGVDRKRSSRIASMPGPLTLAWLPYGRDLGGQTAAARRQGHEMIVHVPMQPDGRDDPGPDALLVGLSPDEIRRRLAVGLSAVDGAVGINNHMGSRFTGDRAGMAVVFAELAARGLLFLDSRTTADTQGPSLAALYRVPFAARHVFLDHDPSSKAVKAALAKVEEVARKEGLGIAIGHPHDVTATALEAWLPTLGARGFQLIPLSAAVREPGTGS